MSEVALAERLGVSRTPLRIALSTLAHEGLLEPLAGGGFVVRSFTQADVADGIELRSVLEGTAARFAAERLRSVSELDPLVRLSEQLDDVVQDLTPESLVRYVELNDAYHEGLVDAGEEPDAGARRSRNVYALPFAAPGALLRSHALLPRSREILIVAQHQHRVLIDAIGQGRGTRAEEIAHEHARLAHAQPRARARRRIRVRPAPRRLAAPCRRRLSRMSTVLTHGGQSKMSQRSLEERSATP